MVKRLLALTFLLSATAFAQAPPHLLLNTNDFARLNDLAKAQPWAARQREKIIEDASAFPANYMKKYGLASIELPPEGAQWAHFYACPDTGTALKFSPPNHNICPDNGKDYNTAPYTQVVYQYRFDALDEGALSAALAFRLTGDHTFAVKSAAILKLFADKYLSYPMHGILGRTNDKNGGRFYSQNLDEAIFLTNISWTYDLLRDSDVFTPADRAHIEKDLILAAAEATTHGPGATANIESFISCATAAAGFTLDNKELIRQATDGPRGFRYQMSHYVLDGFWEEGAMGYQFYALKPLELQAEMSKKAGIDLWKQEPNLEALFISPINIMLPDGSTPPFNDAKIGHLYEHAPLYELAYAELHNPLFGAMAQHGQRDSREAFLFGVPTIQVAGLPGLKSAVFPNAGLAVLRAPHGDLTEILKFGPQGGVHGHFDKLNEVIFSGGGFMSVDPGTQKYGLPIHFTWDRMTVAHNTIGVDETAQVPATGRLLSWQAEPEFTAVTADAGPAYPNADLKRTEILTADYILEISTAKATDSKPHDFDWSYHNNGIQHADANFKPYNGFPQRDGYQILTEDASAQLTGDFHTLFTMPNNRTMNVWVLADPANPAPYIVFTGLAPTEDLRIKAPWTIVRHHATSTTFTTLFQPGPNSGKILTVTRIGNTVHIHTARWDDTIQLAAQITYSRTPLP